MTKSQIVDVVCVQWNQRWRLILDCGHWMDWRGSKRRPRPPAAGDTIRCRRAECNPQPVLD